MMLQSIFSNSFIKQKWKECFMLKQPNDITQGSLDNPGPLIILPNSLSPLHQAM